MIPLSRASLLSLENESESSDCMNLVVLDLSRISLDCNAGYTLGGAKIRWTCRMSHSRRVLRHV